MTNRRKQPLAYYADIFPILDKFLENGEGSFHLENERQVKAWISRAHSGRKRMREIDEQSNNLPPGHGTSKYDKLILRTSKENPTEIRVEFRAPVVGTLTFDSAEADDISATEAVLSSNDVQETLEE